MIEEWEQWQGGGATHGLCWWWWCWRIRSRRSLQLNSPWPTSVFVKAIGSQGEHTHKTMSFAISITSPNTTDADHCTDGGSASAAIMLRNVGIMSPLLSSTWNQSLHCSWELSPSQYVLRPKRKKRKEHHNQTFKTNAIENQLKNRTFPKKQLWKINPTDKKLHHFEVTMESLK